MDPLAPLAGWPGLSDLRGRIAAAYDAQLLLRLRAILELCRETKVRLLVLPEYAVPANLLAEIADRAGDMVVVAGTHTAARDTRELYAPLGWTEPVALRMAVAPVLHRGRIAALPAKMTPALFERGALKEATSWAPVEVGGLPPFGVLICKDILRRPCRYWNHGRIQADEPPALCCSGCAVHGLQRACRRQTR